MGSPGAERPVFVEAVSVDQGSDDDRYVFLQAEELTSRGMEKSPGTRR